jgi:tetratricopeptide (TPR) repeat protein
MKVRLGLLGFFIILFFIIIPPLAAQQPKPAAPHPPAADAAARRQLTALLVQFHADSTNVELRGQIIDLAKTLKPAPLVPLPVRTDYAKAVARLKAAVVADDYKEAARLFEQVAIQAPWFADAYFNAASAYVKGAAYAAAERNLALYMSAVRPGADTTSAENLQHTVDAQLSRVRFQQALDDYQKNPSNEARVALVKRAQQLQPPPDIPQEARQHYAQGKSLADGSSNLEDVRKAIAEFASALQIAPWWPDPARELAAAQATERQFAVLASVDQLRGLTRYSEEDQRARQKIIQAVRALPVPPPMPEDAIRYMARGEALVKMGGAGSYASAANEMEKAVLAAPWSADGYLNLGIVQESAEMYREAILNLRLYLLAAPQAANAHAVQTKIYELEVMQEDQDKTKTLAGTWKSARGHTFHVSVDGNKIRIEMEPYWDDGSRDHITYDLIKKGMTLEGTISSSTDTDVNCSLPSQTNQATGVIGEDFRSIKIKFKSTVYSFHWNHNSETGENVCTGVNANGEMDGDIELVTKLGQ